MVTVLIHRRLDDVLSGSCVYLLGCLACFEEAGFRVRIVIAPVAGFGSKPFCRPNAVFTRGGRKITWPGTLRFGDTYISIRPAVWLRAALRAVKQVVWIMRGRKEFHVPAIPSSLGKPPQPSEQADMIRSANQDRTTVALAEYSSLAGLLGRCRASHRAVLLHDLFSARSRSFRDVGLEPDHETITLDQECDRLADVDLCIHASLTEAQSLTDRLPNKRHIWLPPQPEVTQGGAPSPNRVVFIGVRHGGNQDALKSILEEIWPQIHKRRPDAELWIVGEISEMVQKSYPGVRVLGRIDDLSGIGGPNAVGIAPERAASGISIKVATYLSMGMSVVTRPCALKAYGRVLDDLVVTADTSNDFVERIVSLLDDPKQRQAIAAKAKGSIHTRLSRTELICHLKTLAVASP